MIRFVQKHFFRIVINYISLPLFTSSKNCILWLLLVISCTSEDTSQTGEKVCLNDTLGYVTDADIIGQICNKLSSNHNLVRYTEQLDAKVVKKSFVTINLIEESPNIFKKNIRVEYTHVSIKDSALTYLSIIPDGFVKYDIDQASLQKRRSYFVLNQKYYFLCDSIINKNDFVKENCYDLLAIYKIYLHPMEYYICYMAHNTGNTTNSLFANIIIFGFDDKKNLTLMRKIGSWQPIDHGGTDPRNLPVNDFDGDGFLDYLESSLNEYKDTHSFQLYTLKDGSLVPNKAYQINGLFTKNLDYNDNTGPTFLITICH